MSEKLTFKEYLNSKKALLDAVDSTPEEIIEYEVTKYCNLAVNELGTKQQVKLKPRNKLFVNWMYRDKNKPEVKEIQFEGTTMDDTSLDPSWPEERLLKWLMKNTNKNS